MLSWQLELCQLLIDTGRYSDQDIVFQAFTAKVGLLGGAWSARDIPWQYPPPFHENSTTLRSPSLDRFASFMASLDPKMPPKARRLLRGQRPKHATSAAPWKQVNFVCPDIASAQKMHSQGSLLTEGADKSGIRLGRDIAMATRDETRVVFETPQSVVRVVGLETDSCIINPEGTITYDNGAFRLGGFAKSAALTEKECAEFDAKVGAERDTALKGLVKTLALNVNVHMLSELGDVGLTYQVAHHCGANDKIVDIKQRGLEVVQAVETCDACDDRSLVCQIYCKDCESKRELCATCRAIGHTTWNAEHRACFTCQASGIRCFRDIVYTIAGDGAMFEGLSSLATETWSKLAKPMLNVVMDSPHQVRGWVNIASNWLLFKDGYRFGSILAWALRCGENQDIANEMMEWATEAALLGKDKNNMKEKMIFIRAKLADIYRRVPSMLVTLWEPRYLEWKNKDKSKLKAPRFVAVSDSGNVFVTGEDGLTRFIQHTHARKAAVAGCGDNPGRNVAPLSSFRFKEPRGVVVLEEKVTSGKLCQFLAVVDAVTDKRSTLRVLHLHTKSFGPSSALCEENREGFTVQESNPCFDATDACVLMRPQGGWTWILGMTLRPSGVAIARLEVSSSVKRNKVPHKGRRDVWPASFSLSFLYRVESPLLQNPWGIDMLNETSFIVSDRGKDAIQSGLRRIESNRFSPPFTVETFSDMKSPRGICVTSAGHVVAAAQDVLWQVDPVTGVPTILAGKLGDARSVDGAAGYNALVQPHGVAAEGNTVFVVSPMEDTLRMNTSAVPMAWYLDSGRRQAKIAGLVDPSLAKSMQERARVRDVSLEQRAADIEAENEAYGAWYDAARAKHGRVGGFKALDGSFGVPPLSVHTHRQRNAISARLITERLESIGASDQKNLVKWANINSLGAETLFGQTVLRGGNYNRVQTVATMVKAMRAQRFEHIKNQCNTGFDPITNENPLYQQTKKGWGVDEQIVFKYLARVQATARKNKMPPASAEEKKHISGSKRGRRATLHSRAPKCMQKLAGLLKAQASQRLRDLQRKKALYPMQTMAAVEKELYCICRSAASSDKPMVCCDACEEWFHFDCLQLNECDIEESAGWVCNECEGKGHLPQTRKEASEEEEEDDEEASSDGNAREVAASEEDEEEDEEGDHADDESPSD